MISYELHSFSSIFCNHYPWQYLQCEKKSDNIRHIFGFNLLLPLMKNGYVLYLVILLLRYPYLFKIPIIDYNLQIFSFCISTAFSNCFTVFTPPFSLNHSSTETRQRKKLIPLFKNISDQF